MSLDEERSIDRMAGRSDPGGLASLVHERALDAELAALAWLLVERNVPGIAVSPSPSASGRVRTALIDVLEPDVSIIRLAGAVEEFTWLPEASELGWRRNERQPSGPRSGLPNEPSRTVMVADLEPGAGDASADRPRTWGEHARVAIRALSVGYGMLATARGARLEDMLSALAAPPVGAIDDELAQLGMVLVVTPTEGDAIRVTAAHYLRPVSRDPEGHIRRFGPAVLTTWDPRIQRFEHFAWAITDELAGRIGMSTADLEREQVRRAALLRRLAGEPS